jgi:hypothetical protein
VDLTFQQLAATVLWAHCQVTNKASDYANL